MRETLWGALAMGSWVAGLLLLRSWRDTRDRLFLFLAAGFWSLAFNWFGLAVVSASDETRNYFYMMRLLAFVLIIVGVVDKNRARRS